jgi:hypothetical protein
MASDPHEKIDALVALVDAKAFEPLLRNAADDFYEKLLDAVQNYLRDNADFNLRSDIDSARASARHAEKQLAEISDALGVGQYSQEARLGRIEALKERAAKVSA